MMRRILSVLLACLAGVTAMTIAPTAAQAATCSHGTSGSGQSVYYCPIWVPAGGAPVYASTSTGSGIVDHLDSGGTANWFYCKQDGGTASASGYTSKSWAKTVGDDHGATGWVPAVYFSGAENYWNGLPNCASAPAPSDSCTKGTNSSGATVYYCPIWVPSGGTPVYGSTNTSSGVVDRLLTGGKANWFTCRATGGSAHVSSYTSNSWAKTVGDSAGATGWVPAVYFTGAENYWKGLPVCSTVPPPPPPPPSGGTASGSACEMTFTNIPARALAMIQQACAQRNYIYSWDGGHAATPGATYGACVDGDAWNDCHVIGFDCSGLVRYAYYKATGTDGLNGYTWTQWAKAHNMPHKAELTNAQQSSLKAGDLMWFGASGPSSHHVAIYLGGGKVINAFHSTEHIGVTGYDHDDFIGAVRIW
ncbi:NlpC/P60 family protein [Kribbella sp. NPDC056861]|uniref:C40 family peptidase n=1 Tax=Kribbella sp. NPDC056861 TaxID=3154857 RepID=UPI00341B333D